MKDKYEATIAQLKQENSTLKSEVETKSDKIRELEDKLKDWPKKYDLKVKEVEKLLADMKRQEKIMENRISTLTSK